MRRIVPKDDVTKAMFSHQSFRCQYDEDSTHIEAILLLPIDTSARLVDFSHSSTTGTAADSKVKVALELTAILCGLVKRIVVIVIESRIALIIASFAFALSAFSPLHGC